MFKCAVTSDVVGHGGRGSDMPMFRPGRQETLTRPWLRSHSLCSGSGPICTEMDDGPKNLEKNSNR